MARRARNDLDGVAAPPQPLEAPMPDAHTFANRVAKEINGFNIDFSHNNTCQATAFVCHLFATSCCSYTEVHAYAYIMSYSAHAVHVRADVGPVVLSITPETFSAGCR